MKIKSMFKMLLISFGVLLGNKLKIVKYPIGHFDIYTGEYFEKTINEQILFIKNIARK